jgi:enoyl-CoA hydratase
MGATPAVKQSEMMARPEQFWIGHARWDRPVAVIDLDAGLLWPDDFALPPCPVIGIGSTSAPDAGHVDAIIEPPCSLAGLLAQIAARPLAAASLVQLLRIVPSLSIEQALTAESLAYAVLQGSAEHLAWRAARHGKARGQGSADTIVIARHDDALEIVLDRPETGNAIDRAMRDALHDAFALAALDSGIARVILRARGRVFSLGADLDEFGTTTDPASAHAIRMVTLPAHMAARIAGKLEVQVQGACVGAGLEIAAFAHRIVASPGAWFQLPELAMGVLPGAGGCVSVTRRIGRQRAALLILSGKRLSAARALDWGLIDAIVDDPA